MELACSNRADITNGVSAFLGLTFSLTLGDKLSCQAKRLMPRAKVERVHQRPCQSFYCAAKIEAFLSKYSMKMRDTRGVAALRVRLVCFCPEGIHV